MGPLLAYLGRERLPVAALARLYAQSGAAPGFVAAVIMALGQLDPAITYRAAWLLRKAAAKAHLDGQDWARIAELADASGHWIHRLTMCQLFAESACPPALRAQVFPFLQRCFVDRRVIIRAWALTAMLLFRNDPAYRPAIQRTLRAARRDPGKSMQARLRRLQVA
jgi:hypothetical protein